MSFQPSNAFEEQFRQFLQEPETQDAIRGDQEKEIKVMKKMDEVCAFPSQSPIGRAPVCVCKPVLHAADPRSNRLSGVASSSRFTSSPVSASSSRSLCRIWMRSRSA